MGRKKPQKRTRTDVVDRAERFVAVGGHMETGPWAGLVPRAVDATVLRTDSGRATVPVTWRVVLQFYTADGALSSFDSLIQVVLVDDETGEVREDPRLSTG